MIIKIDMQLTFLAFLALKDIEKIKYSRYIILYNQRLLSSIY